MSRPFSRFVAALSVCCGLSGALPMAALGAGEPQAGISGHVNAFDGPTLDSFAASTSDVHANSAADTAEDPNGTSAVSASIFFDRVGTDTAFSVHAVGEAHADTGSPARAADASSDYSRTLTITKPQRYTATGTVQSSSDGSHCCVTALARLTSQSGGVIFSAIDGSGDPTATLSASGVLQPGTYQLSLSAGAGMGGGAAASADDAGSARFDVRFFLDAPPPCADANGDGNSDDDADGLCDNWEVTGIDFLDDGTVDLQLPGARRDHKDAYLEIDHMASHRPSPGAVRDVVAAFGNAPVANPDGTTGIVLHVETDESVPESANLAFEPCTAAASGGAADFDQIKSARFGTAAQRSAGTDVTNAKRFAYRYVLYAHDLLGLGSTSGCAELPGNDFVVSLGSWTAVPRGGHQVGTRAQQAATLMHELGHTLGLRHGGGTDDNCKPNYLSVMSYTRQIAGSPIVGRPLDYSRSALSTLDEAALSEPAGIGAAAGSVTVFGPAPFRLTPGTAAIDWNRDGDVTDVGVAADINLLPAQGCDGSSTALAGFDDWSNLRFDFRATPDFADGVHSSVPLDPEQTFDQAAASSGDADGDGVRDFEDNCETAANPNQLDTDDDGLGDACGGGAGGPVGGGGGAGGGPTPGGTCDAAARPSASVLKGASGLRLARGRLTLRGRATGTSCRAVVRIEVSISRAVRVKGRKLCRFVGADGRLGKPRACARPVRLRAAGTTAWQVKLKRRLPRGRYTLQVRAVDAAGKRQRTPVTRAFRVR